MMLHSDTVNGNTVLDLHIRTTLDGAFSSITAMALRVNDDLVQIDAHFVYYRGKKKKWEKMPLETPNFTIRRPKRRFAGKIRCKMDIVLNDKSIIRMQRVMLENSLDLLSISIDGSNEDFGGSYGLLGDFTTGDALGRDGRNMTGDWNAYGMEWQVTTDEPRLFRQTREPQLPHARCKMPTASITRESVMSVRKSDPKFYMDAQIACAHAGSDLNDCMEDVLLAKDIKAAEVYKFS